MPPPGSLYQSVPPVAMILPSAILAMSEQNRSPALFWSGGRSGGQLGFWLMPLAEPPAPRALPTKPSPGRPGTPAMPGRSAGLLPAHVSPDWILGLRAPPSTWGGVNHVGVPLRRSRTRLFEFRLSGEISRATEAATFSLLSMPFQ